MPSIDLSKAFDSYYKTKDAQAQLKEKQDGYQKEIQDLITDYQHMGEEAQKLDKAAQRSRPFPRPPAATRPRPCDAEEAGPGQPAATRSRRCKTERSREIQEELFRRHKEIVDEITKVITDYSGPQGFDLVIDKSSASAASGVSIVLYNSSKLIDITTDIITQAQQAGARRRRRGSRRGTLPRPPRLPLT